MYICSMFSQCNPTLSLISYLPSRDKLWSHTSAHSYEVFLMQIKFSFDTVTTCGSRGQVSNLREIFFFTNQFFLMISRIFLMRIIFFDIASDVCSELVPARIFSDLFRAHAKYCTCSRSFPIFGV